jgi:phospholipid transport system transporter-binding protein
MSSLLSTPLPATLTAKEATATLAGLAQALSAHAAPQVLIDASALKHFDSAALAVLLECRRLAQAAGKTCLVSRAPPKLNALAALYGLEGLLPQAEAA